MNGRSQRRIGVDIKNEGTGNELTSEDLLACARLAEQLGFDSVWLNEDIGHDSVALLAAMSQRTESIGLGTAIVNVYSRSALQIAMAAATLDELSHGRASLGLSVGHHPWNDLGHGIPLEAPVARAREYIRFIRKALSGERFTHDGRFFSGVDTRLAFRPPRRDLPIYLGGERPQMVRLAGQVADGLIVNVVSADYIGSFVTEHFRNAARQAGRDPDALELLGIVTCCLADDPAEAVAQARGIFIRRFRSQPTRMIETKAPDFREELLALKDLIDRGEVERAQQEVSEPLVRSLVAYGTAADLWRAIDAHFAAGCTRVAVAAWPRDRVYVERLLHTLAGAPVSQAASPAV